ncbi:threonine/serine dehydratase, partial [Mesorhizobium sp.]
MMTDLLVPTLDHLMQAYAVTSQATQVTPLLESTALAKETGAARVFIKPESLQWAGSFKVRGAYWRLKRLSPDEARKGVVAYSSGNFAQGLAAAGQALGIPVTIVMPIDAPAAKRDATSGYGARVVLTDHGDRAREEVAAAKAREIAETEGLALLHPFDDPEIVAGQAGAGLEALDQLSAKDASADLLFCSVGGGGLIGGVSLAFHYLSPATEIIGVEPEGFNGMGSSLAHGSIETMPIGPKSICDGLMSRRPGDAPFAAVKAAGV